jgi:urease accessory protein
MARPGIRTMPSSGETAIMLRIGHVIGSRLEPAYSEKLQLLENRNAVDEIELAPGDLDRREFSAVTRSGRELMISLPRHERLFDGAVLMLDDHRAIVVRAAGQRWLRLAPRSIGDAIELGYHIGNLGWRVRFEREVLLVAIEGRAENYMVRLGELFWSRRVGMSLLEEDDDQRRASLK